jgi:hypothetical protein
MKLLRRLPNVRRIATVAVAAFFGIVGASSAQAFIHPGGLHNLTDFERMRTNVVAGNHPWIDDWQQLLRDLQSQSSWKPAAGANLGVSRQRADLDAHAAYQSVDGTDWFKVGSTNEPLSSSCSVGLAVTTGSRAKSITSMFDHVNFKSGSKVIVGQKRL